jgi:hypothetical protein
MNGFYRTGAQLGNEDHGQAAGEQAPFHGLALQDHAGRQHQGREKEMHKKAGVTANAEFQSPKGPAQFLTPGITLLRWRWRLDVLERMLCGRGSYRHAKLITLTMQ